MFKLDLSKTYFFPVTVEFPIDGGKFQKSTFDAEFNRLSRPVIKDIFARFPGPDKDVDNVITDNEILDIAFVGWKGVQGSDGEPLPYSETARAAMLDTQGVTAGIIAAFFASIAGSKAKN